MATDDLVSSQTESGDSCGARAAFLHCVYKATGRPLSRYRKRALVAFAFAFRVLRQYENPDSIAAFANNADLAGAVIGSAMRAIFDIATGVLTLYRVWHGNLDQAPICTPIFRQVEAGFISAQRDIGTYFV